MELGVAVVRKQREAGLFEHIPALIIAKAAIDVQGCTGLVVAYPGPEVEAIRECGVRQMSKRFNKSRL